MSVNISSIVKGLPPYTRSTEEIIPHLRTWLSNQDDRYQRKAIKIFENAGVDKRYSIMGPDDVFNATSFEEKNKTYKRECTILAEKTATEALEKANLDAKDIDYIISVSCTGIMLSLIHI